MYVNFGWNNVSGQIPTGFVWKQIKPDLNFAKCDAVGVSMNFPTILSFEGHSCNFDSSSLLK